VHYRYLVDDARQIGTFVQCGITAADHHHVFAPEKVPVADGTVGHSPSYLLRGFNRQGKRQAFEDLKQVFLYVYG
jgi:hypothetical protein